jgi:hypothetical protein
MLLLNVSDSASSQENEANAIEDIDPSVTDEEEEEGSIISVNGTGLGLRTEVETSGENDTDQADSVKRDSSSRDVGNDEDAAMLLVNLTDSIGEKVRSQASTMEELGGVEADADSVNKSQQDTDINSEKYIAIVNDPVEVDIENETAFVDVTDLDNSSNVSQDANELANFAQVSDSLGFSRSSLQTKYGFAEGDICPLTRDGSIRGCYAGCQCPGYWGTSYGRRCYPKYDIAEGNASGTAVDVGVCEASLLVLTVVCVAVFLTALSSLIVLRLFVLPVEEMDEVPPYKLPTRIPAARDTLARPQLQDESLKTASLPKDMRPVTESECSNTSTSDNGSRPNSRQGGMEGPTGQAPEDIADETLLI